MKISCGIIGLPNVGKSSLFNLLTKQNVRSENYPFCTIDPNIGISIVNDKRQNEIDNIIKSQKIIPTQVKFIDIAGLIKGASLGEGLGNKFLSNIRETNAIIHVVRCFKDKNIIHTDSESKIDPIQDIDIINTELLLSDIDLIKNILKRKKTKADIIYSEKDKSFLEKLYMHISDGNNVRSFPEIAKYKECLKNLKLLTLKPIIYIANVTEKIDNSIIINRIKKYIKKDKSNMIILPIKSENENNENFVLDNIINETYKMLKLITFFSVGKKEIKAWSIIEGSSILDAAKKIHSDIKRGFIRAEVISYKDYIKYKGETQTKIAGKCKIEGKKYIVEDGDIINFRFNV